MRAKRLIYYLLLNVLVSAGTTLLVLNLWDRSHNPDAQTFFPFSPGIVANANLATETATVPTVTQDTSLATPAALDPTQAMLVYQVQAYDTFESIAEAHGVSVEALLNANGFSEVQILGAGEALLIPVVPVPEAELRVLSVLGPGDLASERVVLQQVGSGQVSLADWIMEDMQGHIYRFPAFELVNDGSKVEVYTKSGSNSNDSLYWGLDQAIWESGETVVLRDGSGLLRLSYEIP